MPNNIDSKYNKLKCTKDINIKIKNDKIQKTKI